ncbi:MAG: HNH endonuclease family protein [Bdellovibrionota bacterium]|nr:HNH endonuclease family protein [Bdellovibrionota bacterium]
MKIFLFLFALSLTASDDLPKYKRSSFKHWIDKDRDCQNTRAEVLIKRSQVKVSFTQRKNKKKCTVATGLWKDFYYNEIHKLAKKVDIDHIVPLKHAWDHGAYQWSKKEREDFANDPENLVITNRSSNRSKGAQSPLTWMPVERQYACRYMKKWLTIKEKYRLMISAQERDHFTRLNCSSL